ncbi:MAG: metallophosphoesterase [Planctomycetes bacterium]|nr:metallophosphoesterase [Planctomycetota bacterium]
MTGNPFRTGEMVGRVTGGSAVVNLVSAETPSAPILTRVRWAETPEAVPNSPWASDPVVVTEPLARVELPLSELAHSREYFYRVEYTAAPRLRTWDTLPTLGRCCTQRPPGDTFRFCLIADPHWGEESRMPMDGPRWWAATQCLGQILGDGPFDFCIDLGDSAYPASSESAGQTLDHYLVYRDVMADVTRTMPVYMVLGNHEQEAGFFQCGGGAGPLRNKLGPHDYHQLWATAARLKCIPNPRCDTYPEGGEGAPGYDSIHDWWGDDGPWNNGAPTTDLQNFYAWSWGDALFVVLDPFRYTLPGSLYFPNRLAQWSLGPTQMQWLADTLAASSARWKFVLCHHLVGGGPINMRGFEVEQGGDERVYGRGSAIEADRPDTEQFQIHQLMRSCGAQFFVYGHDHAFCHSIKDGIRYVACGRPSHLNPWWVNSGMLASYGSILNAQPSVPWVKALNNSLGYTRFTISPESVVMEWVRTGFSFENDVCPPATARRDWLECWSGRRYTVLDPTSVIVTLPPTDVDAVRTVGAACIPGFFEPPAGGDVYEQPDPVRPEQYSTNQIPIAPFPEAVAVVDTVPEIIREHAWSATKPDLQALPNSRG